MSESNCNNNNQCNNLSTSFLKLNINNSHMDYSYNKIQNETNKEKAVKQFLQNNYNKHMNTHKMIPNEHKNSINNKKQNLKKSQIFNISKSISTTNKQIIYPQNRTLHINTPSNIPQRPTDVYINNIYSKWDYSATKNNIQQNYKSNLNKSKNYEKCNENLDIKAIDRILTDPNPKFKDSKFRQFLKDLRDRKIIIKNNSILKNNEVMVENDKVMKKNVFNTKNVENNYIFYKKNKYIYENKDIESLFKKAIYLMENESLNEAILVLEAILKIDEKSGKAWRLIGKCCFENEQEDKGFLALKNSLKLEPNNLESLLYICIYFINIESQIDALHYLEKWLYANPKYKNFINEKDKIGKNKNFEVKFEFISCLIKNILSNHPDDPDLNIATGLLYNINEDFSKASIYFKKALKFYPTDSTLWNKLGAVLGNANNYRDAVIAYKKALTLRPNYVRAFVNFGISLFEMKRFNEANAAYLSALNLNPTINDIWTLIEMNADRHGIFGLAEICKNKNMEELKKRCYEYFDK